MTDVFSPEKRAWIMSRVKGGNTKPELAVRSMIHRMGFRYRLYRKDLPGCPDIVLPKHKKVVFVHGCFWHGHKKCNRSKRPTSNIRFWNEKLDGNIERDRKIHRQLRRLGWKSLVVWQCELKRPELVQRRLERFLIGQQK